MLVLALQFSRCGDRRVRSAQGIRRRGAGRGIDSLKTEEKTVDAGDARWREETYDLYRLPATTHQCTNWDVQTPGDRSITKRCGMDSLERR
jgi:hypothetical protein